MQLRYARRRGRTRAAAAWLAGLVVVASCSSPAPPSGGPSPSGSASQPAASTVPTAAVSGSPAASVPPTETPAPATGYTAIRSTIHLPKPLTRAVAFATGSQILVAGGLTARGTTAAVLAIDPTAGTVTSTGKLKHKTHDAAGSVLNGTALVIGGGDTAAEVWIQSVAADGTVADAGVLPRARADLGAATVGDQLIVAGGSAGNAVDQQVLGTTDGTHFTVLATLLQGVRYPAVAAMNGKVYVIGGAVGKTDTAEVQIVDIANGTVSLGPPLAGPISRATALVVGGAILVLGGAHKDHANALMQRIDPVDDSVTTVGQLPYKVADAAGVVVDGTGYLIGGEAPNPIDSIIVVTPSP